MDWPINLTVRPRIAQMAIATHGVSRPVDRYRLPALWCLHLYRYRATVFVNRQALEIHPGHVSVFPPDAALEYHYRGKSVHAYVHFQLPPVARATERIPTLQEAPGLNTPLEEAIGWFPGQQLRAEVRVWDILWQLTAVSQAVGTQHPAVAEARRLIELRVSEVIYITDLAKAVSLSQNHLTRLFTAATGKTVAAYIRDRRIERATHLLRHSTLSIKAIANEVGIPDLHLFNKYVRRALGVAPRTARTPKR